jgi:quinol monooxygenase YgiN
MKVVRVQYTLKPGHVAANQQNIAAVVAELKALNHPGIKYGAWLLPDGKSFMHFDQFTDEAAHLTLQELPSFKKFAAELWAAGFDSEPVLELLSPVASTERYF